jgi:hypothetical protein
MLVPAGFLVVLVLASIAVDMALVQLRQRQAVDLAAAAANDAATAAAEDVRRHGAGDLRVSQPAAEDVVDRIVAADELAPLVVGAPVVTVDGNRIEVELAVRADYLFAAVVPGAPHGATVRAHASAAAVP